MILNRKEVLLANDIVKELVHIPEWGGDVYVRGMSGEARDKFEMLILQTNGKSKKANTENFRAKLASMTVCDENGDLLFTEDDVKELAKKSACCVLMSSCVWVIDQIKRNFTGTKDCTDMLFPRRSRIVSRHIFGVQR